MKLCKVFILLITGSILFSCVTKAPPAEVKQEQFFELGQTGPGGGIVFYDAGSYEKGWRYLEVELNSSYEWAWGDTKNYLTAKERNIGSGPANTKRMIEKIKGEFTAADGCSNVKHGNGSCDDWFLPSADELFALYEYLLTTDYKPKSSAYWTSTEYSKTLASYITLEGREIYGTKTEIHGITPIRAF